MSDKDCKLDRICERARCVAPGHRDPAGGSLGVPVYRSVPSSSSPLDGQAAGSSTPSFAASGEPARAMFRMGPAHRGRSPFVLPSKRPVVAWSYQTGGPVTSSPALLGGAGVAVGSHDGKLYVLGADGTLRWSHATGDLIFSSPAVGGDGTIYVGSDDDHLYAFDGRSPKPVWTFQVGSCSQRIGTGPEASRCDADAGPTLGPDGTLYTGGDGVYAIRSDGTLRWRFPTGGHVSSAPALLPDGSVVVGSQDDLIYAIAPDGTKRWDFRTGGDVESSPSVGEDGTIYVGSDDRKLYALGLDGVLRWAFTAGGDIRASVAQGDGGTLYFGAFDSLFYAVRRDGTLAWTFRTGDRILSSALVDARGAILFGAQDDRLYVLERDGQLRWSVELGGDVDSSAALAEDGTIYVGSDDRKLYALRPREDKTKEND